MKKIHFYKKNKLVYSVWADSIEKVEADPKDYFENYTNDMIISAVEYINPVVDSKGDLREKTRDELVAEGVQIQLELGEKIVGKKIVKVPKPDEKNYWNWDGQNWVYDNDKEKTEYFSRIDEIKAKRLNYGFDYKVADSEHRQRCRDKDIAYMVANVVALQTAKSLGMDKKTTWYFEDNFGVKMDLTGLGTLMLFGTTFVQSVFDTEIHFKKNVSAKKITEEEFEAKRKEIHNELVKGS